MAGITSWLLGGIESGAVSLGVVGWLAKAVEPRGLPLVIRTRLNS